MISVDHISLYFTEVLLLLTATSAVSAEIILFNKLILSYLLTIKYNRKTMAVLDWIVINNVSSFNALSLSYVLF